MEQSNINSIPSLIFKKNAVNLIFVAAFLIRATVVIFLEPDRPVESDGKYYYETAINLANGKGYTWDGTNPFFFREPGVIYFYAGCLKIYKVLQNIEILTKSESHCKYYMWTYTDLESRNSLLFIRIIQALIQTFTVILFYLVIKRYVSNKLAILTVLALSFYPPYFFHVFSILREILVAFLLIFFTYIWSLYLENKKDLNLFIIGVIWGMAALTFQVYLILGGVLILYFIIVNYKSLIKIIKPITLLFIGFILTVSPWIIKVYKYYPDIRIIKTLGISFTHEHRSFIKALTHCDDPYAMKEYSHNFSQDECEMDYRHIMWYYESSEIHFKKSFDGTYSHEARILRSLTSKQHKIESFTSDLKNNIKQSFFRFGTENLVWVNFGHFKYWKISFYFIGLLSIFGIVLNTRNYAPFSLIYFFHIGLFWIIGSEARRMLPIHPFMILFAFSTLNVLALKLIDLIRK